MLFSIIFDDIVEIFWPNIVNSLEIELDVSNIAFVSRLHVTLI